MVKINDGCPMEDKFLRQPALEVDNKALSNYIYLTNFETISLENHEYDVTFLKYVLTKESLISLADIYLNFLNKKESEKFNGLKKENGFDLEEVLKSLSSDLKNNFYNYGVILDVQRQKELRRYPEVLEPLKIIMEIPYLHIFLDGLDLNLLEKEFLLLNMFNRNWSWLFPERYSDEYKSKVFTKICKKETETPQSLTRKLNNKFLNMGLFSDPWEVSDFVYAFFIRDNPRASLQRCFYSRYQDFYDYKNIEELNSDALGIMIKQLCEYNENKKGCFQLLAGESDFRNKNLLEYLCGKNGLKLYEMKTEIPLKNRAELCFYLYALSIELCQKKSVLYLSQDFAKEYLLKENEPEIPLQNKILSHIKCPVVISLTGITPDTKKMLKQQGIDVLFSTDLKLPNDKNKDKVLRYFTEKKIPVNLLPVAVDECMKLRIGPENWEKLCDTLDNAKTLSKEEAERLLENQYESPENKNVRKNSHYCLEALNTSESIHFLTKALKNADNYQTESFDAESGIRVLLLGPSGTGKTAYVEEISKEINKPLVIIRASDILSPYVGETELNIKAAFDDAIAKRAILLIDECDSFIHARGDSINRHNDIKVNEFLVQMERFPGILFCNTNLAESLDKATDRRFHFKVDFKPLTKEGVTLLCESYFNNFKLSEEQINRIYRAGDVTPGDFGALNGRIRFLEKETLTSEYITEELCKIVEGKTRSWEKHKIGFGG